jgi:hypothetical protein
MTLYAIWAMSANIIFDWDYRRDGWGWSSIGTPQPYLEGGIEGAYKFRAGAMKTPVTISNGLVTSSVKNIYEYIDAENPERNGMQIGLRIGDPNGARVVDNLPRLLIGGVATIPSNQAQYFNPHYGESSEDAADGKPELDLTRPVKITIGYSWFDADQNNNQALLRVTVNNNTTGTGEGGTRVRSYQVNNNSLFGRWRDGANPLTSTTDNPPFSDRHTTDNLRRGVFVTYIDPETVYRGQEDLENAYIAITNDRSNSDARNNIIILSFIRIEYVDAVPTPLNPYGRPASEGVAAAASPGPNWDASLEQAEFLATF